MTIITKTENLQPDYSNTRFFTRFQTHKDCIVVLNTCTECTKSVHSVHVSLMILYYIVVLIGLKDLSFRISTSATALWELR